MGQYLLNINCVEVVLRLIVDNLILKVNGGSYPKPTDDYLCYVALHQIC